MDTLSAEAMRERIKKREAAILGDLDANEELVVEFHAPTGTTIQIRDVGYYAKTDDVLLLAGTDTASGEECQIIAATQMIQLVFRVRVVKAEDQPLERKQMGFIRTA